MSARPAHDPAPPLPPPAAATTPPSWPLTAPRATAVASQLRLLPLTAPTRPPPGESAHEWPGWRVPPRLCNAHRVTCAASLPPPLPTPCTLSYCRSCGGCAKGDGVCGAPFETTTIEPAEW